MSASAAKRRTHALRRDLQTRTFRKYDPGEKFGFSDFFQVVVGSEMDERRTRKDEVIEEVFARLDKGDVRGESLMIGDREHDIFGAKKCGVESVGMRLGFAREGELEEAGADHIVSDFKALRALLLTL